MITAKAFAGNHYAVYGLARSGLATAPRVVSGHYNSVCHEPAIRPMIPLGQFRDTFIIAVDDEGIAIIDQHVAHERVLFERVMERLTSGRLDGD